MSVLRHYSRIAFFSAVLGYVGAATGVATVEVIKAATAPAETVSKSEVMTRHSFSELGMDAVCAFVKAPTDLTR